MWASLSSNIGGRGTTWKMKELQENHLCCLYSAWRFFLITLHWVNSMEMLLFATQKGWLVHVSEQHEYWRAWSLARGQKGQYAEKSVRRLFLFLEKKCLKTFLPQLSLLGLKFWPGFNQGPFLLSCWSAHEEIPGTDVLPNPRPQPQVPLEYKNCVCVRVVLCLWGSGVEEALSYSLPEIELRAAAAERVESGRHQSVCRHPPALII